MDSSITIPITFWSNSKPTFRISTIYITPNYKKLVTGSYTGQLCLWNLNIGTCEIVPRNLLIGHRHSVTCIVGTDDYIISSTDGGEISRWNLDDGYCTKTNKSLFVHRNMQLFNRSESNEELLFTCGDYSEIFIIHPFTLQVIFILYSKHESSWIANFHVISSQNNKSDMVSGITINGCVKLWVIDNLENDLQHELHSHNFPVNDVVDLKYNPSRTEILVVSVKNWIIFDSELLNCICQVEIDKKQRCLGGNFCDSDVVVWTNTGKFYVYDVNNGEYSLKSIIFDDNYKISLIDPVMTILQSQELEKYFIRSDYFSRIDIWGMYSKAEEQQTLLSTKLNDIWVTSGNGFFKNSTEYSSVTCSIYIMKLDKFFLGCFNGAIVSISAVQSMMSICINSTNKTSSHEVLLGHKGKVNCLIYPYEKYSHFSKSYLVSGGSDFSVCLWDIHRWELLYKFCVQGGEILRLLIPPKNCTTRVKHSICSVASDHSVAILNLKDKKCIILTSRHEYPIVTVNWKPLDDFIIIECFDGTVYVWQMETGHLDRVLDGVMAQEVLYGCRESNQSDMPLSNFYINEKIIEKNSMKRELFQVDKNPDDSPFMLNGFLVNDLLESHIFTCNVEYIVSQVYSGLESKKEDLNNALNKKLHLMAQPLCTELQKKPSTLLEKIKQETEHFHEKFQSQKTEKAKPVIEKEKDKKKEQHVKFSILLNESSCQMIQLFLSSIHVWGINQSLDELIMSKLGLSKPELPISYGLSSQPGIYSLFLPDGDVYKKSSSLIAITCISMITLSKIMDPDCDNNWLFDEEDDDDTKSKEKDWWGELYSLYELICLNPNNHLAISRPKLEILGKTWSTKCIPIRDVVRKLLTNYLTSLTSKEIADLLEYWYEYLPHFKILDKTKSGKFDLENLDLKTIALVLFGIIGSDLKFKSIEFSCQEKYIYQTCAGFVYLLLIPEDIKNKFSALETIAVDFIGRGYIVWEQFLKMEKIFPSLFEMCAEFFKSNVDFKISQGDKCLTAHNSLKSIAVARTAAFINCLMIEINQIRSPHPVRNDHFLQENSKPVVLSILTYLLDKTPFIMLLYLNDVISLIIFCIDFTHLKQENLSNLMPVMKKFRQVHHSVPTQRIAVGLGTGSVVLYDLKTGKAHSISAHKDSVSAVKFSEDGKFLVTYSCYENRLCFWQILTGIFGLGHVHVKCIKSYHTFQIHDEEIRNHLEIAQLNWADQKSVILKLCDGTETIFHS